MLAPSAHSVVGSGVPQLHADHLRVWWRVNTQASSEEPQMAYVDFQRTCSLVLQETEPGAAQGEQGRAEGRTG